MILVDETKIKNLKADIRVIGVGGGGGNVIETMIKEGIKAVKFISINTDAQALSSSSAEVKIQLGEKLTKGLGAGANPEIGRRAAMESYEDIVAELKGADMVFITAGMGGGTGTGGVPVVAEAARDLGILTVGIVTYPFMFEGNRRKKYADAGISELKKHVDILIVIPNEKLLGMSSSDTPLLQTFKKTDEILLQAVKGITELVSVQGLINLDFADLKTIMSNQGLALMGIGTSKGKNRAIEAVSQAISSPLLADLSINGSRGLIVNITAGQSLSLSEVNQATSCLTKVVDPDAEIIVGAVINESLGETLSVTLIATGFGETNELESHTIRSLSKSLKTKSLIAIETQKNEANADQEPEDISTIQTQQSSISHINHESKITTEEKIIKSKEIESQTESKHFGEADSSLKEQAEPIPFFNAEQDHQVITQQDNQDKQSAEDCSNQSEKENLSLRDKLLLKAKEHSEKQKQEQQNSQVLDQQIDMDWKKDSSEEITYSAYSPFEADIDLSDEDLN